MAFKQEQINRRDFLKAAGVTAAAIGLAGIGGNTLAAPSVAEARSYSRSANILVRTRNVTCCDKLKINIRQAKLTYVNNATSRTTSETYECSESQGLAIDAKNKRYYVITTDSDVKVAALWSAPITATSKEHFKLVAAFGNEWMGHANGMCCIPDGKGTRIYVPDSDTNIRTLYIPDASAVDSSSYDPANFAEWGKIGSWKCDFCPRSIDYDVTSGMFLVRSGRFTSSGVSECRIRLIKAPTNDEGAMNAKVSVDSYFDIELPDSIYVNAGVFGSKAETFNAGKSSGRGKQDIAYHNGYLYLPVSDTKDKRWLKSSKNGVKTYRTNRNVIIRYKVGSIATAIKSGHKLYRANKVLLDVSSTIVKNGQGYEIESIDFYNDKMYFVTNESPRANGKSDEIRVLV